MTMAINKQGFTLVEILLAVMILGIIGLSLAAITTAALRESSVGRTRIILRNQLSVAIRQLRQDIQLANTIYADGSTLILNYDQSKKVGPTIPTNLPAQIQYTYDQENEVDAPGHSMYTSPKPQIGGRIYRTVVGGETKLWLDNVKRIADYPSFIGGEDSRIRVKIIVQSNSFPVVNEVFDETFYTPHGVQTCDSYVQPMPADCGQAL